MGWAGRVRRRLPPPPGGLEGLRRPRGQEQVAVQTEEVPPLAAELAQVVYPCLGLAPMSSLTLDPNSSKDSNAPQVHSLVVEDCLDDGAGVRATDDHAGSLARDLPENCATRNLAPPHDPTLGSASHLRGCVGT
jgi:hypothetical protein